MASWRSVVEHGKGGRTYYAAGTIGRIPVGFVDGRYDCFEPFRGLEDEDADWGLELAPESESFAGQGTTQDPFIFVGGTTTQNRFALLLRGWRLLENAGRQGKILQIQGRQFEICSMGVVCLETMIGIGLATNGVTVISREEACKPDEWRSELERQRRKFVRRAELPAGSLQLEKVELEPVAPVCGQCGRAMAPGQRFFHCEQCDIVALPRREAA